ncbi:hypothetical protein NW768_004118 [Fusarium equiseti]|uniref:Heterokaryon incompatibility domain-containing protein n=1 Tax=Fusarium equiseti TaxID=61235 RepID=A0ABQ8RJN7_FUSEQ|nr:hypothetical protein NW768_004118 [Fusarium equiseti]
MNVDESTYRTQHVSGQCGCTFLEVPIKVLHHLVDQQAIPLVRYHSGSLEVTQLRMDEPNVVFSHVWADGLGNVSGKNALPTCQVIRLQEIANMTFVEHDSTPIPFYIDTLCVPREMEFRKKAIKKMRDVYKSAMKVLVLDREIQALSSDDSKTQKITTIYFSGWMRRLWTYQEGALNKSLFFKLSDTILKIDSIWAWLSESWDTAEGGCVRHMISLVVHTLRVQDTRAIPPALSLVAINDAFRWRSTSRSEDEAIVISILLGLDTETLLKAKGTERMKMVLQSLGKVPLPLASLSSDRMEEEGYTWAPKSLLNVKKHFLYAALSSWYSNMLRINPQITSGKVDNEADVADVLETGALSFKSKGYAIYPAGVSPSRISSPFWLIEFVGMHEGMVVVEKCWRVLSWPDLKGLPQALPQEVFFLIPVERPHRNSWERYLVMTAFIVLASKETQDFVQQRFFAEEFSIDVLPCRFYCRVEVCMMDMSDLETQPLYKAEFFDGDAGESYKVPRTDIKPTESFSHLVRQIHCKKWVVS